MGWGRGMVRLRGSVPGSAPGIYAHVLSRWLFLTTSYVDAKWGSDRQSDLRRVSALARALRTAP